MGSIQAANVGKTDPAKDKFSFIAAIQNNRLTRTSGRRKLHNPDSNDLLE
jgi:hypothetical protein